MNTATRLVSQTCALPRSRSPAITASITESWTMTRDIGAITRSPACASRPDARERAGVGQGLDPPRDLLELIFAEFEPELFRAMVDRVPAGQPVRDVDRPREAKVGRVEYLVGVGVEVDGLCVHAGLVVESVLAGHEVVVGDLDPDERG